MILKSGDKLKHYKGGIYEVICIAKCSKTENDMVVYKDIKNDEIWVRPLHVLDDVVPSN